MLAIRMQRTGRKGHAMFRVVVQDARRTPTSGKVVARLGSYDPHAKTVTLDKEKASFYLEHGAQPSGRAALLLKKEGVKLPDWVSLPDKKEGKVRNPEKRRSTRPDEPAPAEEAPAPETEAPAEAPTEEVPAENAEAAEPEKTDEKVESDEPAETLAESSEEPKVEEAEPEASEEKPAGEADQPESSDKPDDEAKS